MKRTFKWLAVWLLVLQTQQVVINHNYNYSRVHQQALISQPVFLPTHPVPNAQHHTHIPSLIEYSQLKKYQLRDTNYRVEEQSLSHLDHLLLFDMEPPAGIFQSELVHIQNYRLLEMRKFEVSLTNPSKQFKIVITQICTDRTEVKRDDERRALPIALHPSASHQFSFVFYAAQLNPQFIQATIYFFIEIYDGSVLAEEKVYARKVSSTVTPNHLRLENNHYSNCPHYHTITIKNYETFQIGVKLEGRKKFETVEGIALEGETRLQPTKHLKLLVEGRKTQMEIHTIAGVKHPIFPSLMLEISCEESLTLDYFNIGILPDQKNVYSYPITVSNHRQENASIEEIVLESTGQTVAFEELQGFSGLVPPTAKNMQIGTMKIYARRRPQKKSVVNIRLRVVTPQDQFTTEQVFMYQEIRNPISAGSRRFVDLRKLNPKKERFMLKNNLNLPLFLTKFYCDESMLQLVWTGQRRKVVYPNHSIQELSFLYIGPSKIPLSPQKHLILLQFNGNLIIPIEIVVFDQTLKCLVENQQYKCGEMKELDFGYFRDQKTKGRQLIVRNWNPQGLMVRVELPLKESKDNGISMVANIYGPLPTDDEVGWKDKDKQVREFLLKPNHFILVNFQVQLMFNGTSANLPLRLTTSQQTIFITLIITVENGTIALIPQTVRFQTPYERTIEYLNLVSTYSQKYRIASVSTNCSNVIVAIPPHGDLQGNQFVGMTVVYQPYMTEQNNTLGDWSAEKKQTEYYLYRFKREFEPFIYTQVRLVTSTELQAKSTIIIEKNYKPLIPDSFESKGGQGIRQMKFTLTKRKPKVQRYGQARQLYQFSFIVKNPFPFPIKYKPFLVSEIKFKLIENYFKQYRQSKQHHMEPVFFCISEAVKSKYRLTPSVVKEIFNLGASPDQYFLDVSTDQTGETLMSMRPKNPKNKTYNLIPRTLDFEFMMTLEQKLYRTCYYFVQHQLIARLVLTQLPYRILEQEGDRAFRDFIKAELNNLDHMAFFQAETDVPIKVKKQYYQYCWEEPPFIVYRFCDTLHARIHSVVSSQPIISNDGTLVVIPGQSQKVTIQISYPNDKMTMYVVLANNFTKFQTYQTQILIKHPQLYVSHDYMSPLFSQISDQIWGKWRGPNLLPVQLLSEDYRAVDSVLEGTRVFELVNEGEGPIVVDHLGIDQKHFSCTHKGVEIFGLNCRSETDQFEQVERTKRNFQQKFTLHPLGRYNLTIRFLLNLKTWPVGKKHLSNDKNQYLRYTIYLYDQKGYYFKLHLVFRMADNQLSTAISFHTASVNYHKMYGYFSLSAMSFFIICLFLLRLKNEQKDPTFKTLQEKQKMEEDPYKRMYRLRRLGRILNEPSYYDTSIMIGAKLNKRCSEKPIHKVTEDLILSAKETTQRELKKYFNQSEESAIGAVLEINHHLSLSHQFSDQEIVEEPQTLSDPTSEYTSQDAESEKSSNLPEGQEVELIQELQEDSWYDFNKQALNNSHNKSNTNINPHVDCQQRQKQEFYNVFRTDVGLKKPTLPQSKRKWQ